MIGSTVDENGLLDKVFALIPLAWFFLLFGMITRFYQFGKIGARKSGKVVFKLKQYLY